jgi:hypothetical protein
VNDGRRCRNAERDRGRLSFTAWTRLTGRESQALATGSRIPSRRGRTCSRDLRPALFTVHLPSHLDWSGNSVYDLDAPGRVVDLYRAVLIEAAGHAETQNAYRAVV